MEWTLWGGLPPFTSDREDSRACSIAHSLNTCHLILTSEKGRDLPAKTTSSCDVDERDPHPTVSKGNMRGLAQPPVGTQVAPSG